MIFANRIASSTSCSISRPETFLPSSSRDLFRLQLQNCNTSFASPYLPNVTAHPSAAWTLQQLREAIPSDHTYRFILHDHNAIFSTGFDHSVARLDLEVIKSPCEAHWRMRSAKGSSARCGVNAWIGLSR
jgi:hypothetical protein